MIVRYYVNWSLPLRRNDVVELPAPEVTGEDGCCLVI